MRWTRKKPAVDGNHTCICGNDSLNSDWIKCGARRCPNPWWHMNCAGLTGLSSNDMKVIKYRCPCCCINKFEDKWEDALAESVTEIKSDVITELKKALPGIIKNIYSDIPEPVSHSANMKNCGDEKKCEKPTVKNISADSTIIKKNVLPKSYAAITEMSLTPKYTEKADKKAVEPNTVKFIKPLKKDKANSKEFIYLKPVSDDLSDIDKVNQQKKVSQALNGVEVCFLHPNNSTGIVTIGFPDVENKNKALEIIKEMNLDYKLNVYGKSLPKLSVNQIPNEVLEMQPLCEKTEERVAIKEAILAKSEVIKDFCSGGHTFDIIYFKKYEKHSNIGIKVSPSIRNYIIGRGYLFIGNTSCPVSDRFFVKQCYHCQQIGHMAKDCSQELATCLFCAGTHKSSDCSVKSDHSKHACSNCSKHKLLSDKINHTANSYDCCHIQKEILRIQNKIEYASKNVM